jgi:hypothetical protein
VPGIAANLWTPQAPKPVLVATSPITTSQALDLRLFVLEDEFRVNVKLQGGKAASEQNILALETGLGCKLSDSFRKFLQAHDGAKPETNIFKINGKNECGVNRFIPSDEVLCPSRGERSGL